MYSDNESEKFIVPPIHLDRISIPKTRQLNFPPIYFQLFIVFSLIIIFISLVRILNLVQTINFCV